MSTVQQSHMRSGNTWANAPTRSVDVSGTKFAYRQLGVDDGVPVIFLNHLAAELDRWDPRVVDGIASRRRVIAFDNRGSARRRVRRRTRSRGWRGTPSRPSERWVWNRLIFSASRLEVLFRR